MSSQGRYAGRTKIAGLLVAAMLMAWVQAAAGAPNPQDLKAEVEGIVNEQAKSLVSPKDGEPAPSLAPGGIIGVYIKGKELFFPYGRIDDAGHPPTRDTLFGLGSVTKTFTTSILGQRPELFNRSVTAAALPPGYKLQPTEAPVTFEQLATFTGGVPKIPDNCGIKGKPACDQKLFVDFINGVTPKGGKLPAANLYSNAGIGFLGQILMFQDGFTSFGPAEADHWYEGHLFSALDMRHTSYPPNQDADHPLADAYAYSDGGYEKIDYAPWVPWGTAGRVFSTAADMVRFIMANVGVSTIDGHPVPEKILEGMRQALLPRTAMSHESAERQGFAWVVRPEELPIKSRIIGKDGGLQGVSSYVAVNPDLRYGVIVMVNMEGVGVRTGALRIMEALQLLASKPD